MSDDPPKKRDKIDVALQWADFCPDDPLAGPAVPIGKGWLCNRHIKLIENKGTLNLLREQEG